MARTFILGINAFHADSAAVLLADGEVVGAIAEERLNRIKHFAGFPRLAVRKLLEMAGIDVRQIDHVAVGRDARANLSRKIGFSIANVDRLGRLARQRLESRAKIRGIAALVAEAGEARQHELKARIHNVEHHLAHAASAFFTSEHRRAAILSIDGFGDFTSTMTALGEDTKIGVLDRILFPHSLGLLYTAISQFIGFTSYGDEGKVMGLAPYGEPRYLDLFRTLVSEKEGGRFELDLRCFVHHTEGVDYRFEGGVPVVSPLYSGALVGRLGAPRAPGEEITARDRDIARSLQARLEEIYVHILQHLSRSTQAEAVCVAGGVALNSVANGKILSLTPFRRFATHPAAGDDGTALGAAFFVRHVVLKAPRGEPIRHAFLGASYDDDEIGRALARAGVPASRLEEDELVSRTAKRLAQGKIVGWFQGRMEWGPRALGARSILAHPGLPEMKDVLNARIKHRERFRPFAPSILEERVGDYFTETHPSPFMMLVYPTRPERRADIQATDHVDHTGRLQTVRAADCPRYYRLIRAFEAETGIPVLLNTSFNENEPIVCAPEEAIACFLRTKMDVLVLGTWFVERDAFSAPYAQRLGARPVA